MQRRKLWALDLLILIRSSLCGRPMNAVMQFRRGGAKFLDSLIQERLYLHRLLRLGIPANIKEENSKPDRTESHSLEKIGKT